LSGVFSLKLWVSVIANRFFVFLGLISYNLYIWHQLIAFYLYNHRIVLPSVPVPRDDLSWQLVFTLIVSVGSLLFASLLTFCFERPLMKYGIKNSVCLILQKLGLHTKKI